MDNNEICIYKNIFPNDMNKFTFGTREMNKLLDDTLMNKYPFASETLMELAGLAIAQVSNKILK